MARRLTLIAGSGALVPIVAAAARQRGDALQVLDVVGRRDIAGDSVRQVTLADAAGLIEAVKSFRTSHMVLAGAVRLSDADREGLARAFGLAGKVARSLGDVGFAGMVLVYCRVIGVKLIGPQEIAPELLAPAGLVAGPPLSAELEGFARKALQAARAVGAIDLGQAVVLSGERPIAAEDAAGTDALLERVGVLRGQGLAGNGVAPLILAKALKPRQPRFADLPTIGVRTLRNAAAAGIGVIAVEAGRSLVLERAELETEAAGLGVSIVGVKLRNG
jgi:hypothetical protein